MATELLQPGVSVIQEFRTVSPTITTPTLVPCSIAPCYQVIEAQEKDSTGNTVLNAEAVASVPALITSSNPGLYNGLDGLTFSVSYNEGAAWAVTLSDPTGVGLDVGNVVGQITASSPAPSGWGAYKVTKSGSDYVQIRTTSGGDGQSLRILDGTANTLLGFNPGYASYGASTYKQDHLTVSQKNFPDPRGIIDEIDVNEASIRVFMDMGTSLKEFNRYETFLRQKRECVYTSDAINFPTTTLTGKVFSYKDSKSGNAVVYTFAAEATNVAALASAMNNLIGSVLVYVNGATKIDLVSPTGYFEVVAPSTNSAHDVIKWTDGDKSYTLIASNDGDGDTRTPFVIASRDLFGAPVGSATMTGTASLVSPVAVNTKTFQFHVDGDAQQEVKFVGDRIIASSVYVGTSLNAMTLTLTVNGQTKVVTFTDVNPVSIDDAITAINSVVGSPVCYKSDDSGNYALAGTYLTFVLHTASYTEGAKPSIVDGGDVWLDHDASTGWSELGLSGAVNLYQTLSGTDVVAQLNATIPGSSSVVSNYLVLSSLDAGNESKVEVGNGTANTLLGFTSGQVAYGDPFPVASGDAVYADGTFIGYVAVATPGGDATKLKLDREVSTSAAYTYFYIEALNIPTPVPSGRPTPDLVVLSDGSVSIKHDFARDTEGNPLEASGQLVISYNALRLDVTVSASDPSMLTVENTTDLTAALSPINTDNPLALMLYYMLINGPGISVTGLGVDATSADEPEGTEVAYSKCATFLKKEEEYALALGTQNSIVHQLFAEHVTSTSAPDSKGERIVFINPAMPGEALPDIISSGTDGDSTGSLNEFETKLPTLGADLLAVGIDPTGTISASEGVYLDIASDSKKYSVSSVDGTKVTIRTAFAPGENDDSFFASSSLPTTLISETFAVYKRGAELVTTDGDPDYDGIAQAYQDLGKSYGNRRVFVVAPEKVGAVIDGIEQKIPGYYLTAAIAAMVGQQPPQQGFTNFPIIGFTRVFGTNDVFSSSQMNVAAAGGIYNVVQYSSGTALTARHQLSTDITSVETRELSITKVVDFVAKFMRSGLRNFIGKFNITQPFLDTLSSVVQGQLSFLTDAGVITGGDLNNIVQDKMSPDTVLIDVTLDVPYPCNYIRLALVI